MPMIDLPLEKLHAYAGRNPRPDDFDAYWDEGLAEIKQVDAAARRVPAAFESPTAVCFDLYFTGVGGATIHAKLALPRHRPAAVPAVVQFHGYTGRSPDFSELMTHITRGHAVAALDCRGQAGQSQDLGGVSGNTHHGHIIRGLEQGPRHLLYRSIFLDCAQLAGIVMDMPEIDGARVASWGGSQGGALALACAALEPRIARCATTHPFLSDYQRVWEMDQAKDAYAELRSFFRMFDPTHARESEWFRRLGYIDIQFLMPRVRAKVLLACGLMDTVCPPSTQFAAYNKITSPKELVIYPDFAHEAYPGWPDRVYAFLGGL
jgi:cephalosporin-C deacetylase